MYLPAWPLIPCFVIISHDLSGNRYYQANKPAYSQICSQDVKIRYHFSKVCDFRPKVALYILCIRIISSAVSSLSWRAEGRMLFGPNASLLFRQNPPWLAKKGSSRGTSLTSSTVQTDDHSFCLPHRALSSSTLLNHQGLDSKQTYCSNCVRWYLTVLFFSKFCLDCYLKLMMFCFCFVSLS